MVAGAALLDPHLRVTASGPMEEHDDLTPFFFDIHQDLANQNAHNPLLPFHVRREGHSTPPKDQECPAGITASGNCGGPTRVVEVPGREPAVRIFVVQSEERE